LALQPVHMELVSAQKYAATRTESAADGKLPMVLLEPKHFHSFIKIRGTTGPFCSCRFGSDRC
ncbi:hypothetical protein GOODEAATRI_034364, partial [Goodea atripinnis]